MTIHTVTHNRQARDSNGRTMMEMKMGCGQGKNGQVHPPYTVNVNDPVAKTTLNWQVGDFGPKVVHVFHLEERLNRSLTPEAQATLLAQRKIAESQEVHRENDAGYLGSKTINGVMAEGTRSTRTIPAGEEGNVLPLDVVHEEWRSNQLGVLLLVIDDDPRRGKTTLEYEELTLGEPDPALFAPPAGYEVKEIHPTVGRHP